MPRPWLVLMLLLLVPCIHSQNSSSSSSFNASSSSSSSTSTSSSSSSSSSPSSPSPSNITLAPSALSSSSPSTTTTTAAATTTTTTTTTSAFSSSLSSFASRYLSTLSHVDPLHSLPSSSSPLPTHPPAAFQHDNVRCTCSCPTLRYAISRNDDPQLPRGSCLKEQMPYRAAFRGGEETCVVCMSQDRGTMSKQCNYVTVTDSEGNCDCLGVLPVEAGATQATTADCRLCECTYQLRRQGLVKGVVYLYFVALGTLLLILLFNIVPHGLFKLNPYGLSLRRADSQSPHRRVRWMKLPSLGDTSAFVPWRLLQRQPTQANIGW